MTQFYNKLKTFMISDLLISLLIKSKDEFSAVNRDF